MMWRSGAVVGGKIRYANVEKNNEDLVECRVVSKNTSDDWK